MKRSGFKPKPKPCAEGMATTARAVVKVFKPKKCDARKGGCGLGFTPRLQLQKACGPQCAQAMVAKAKAKKAAEALAEDGRQTRARLEEMKGIPKLKNEAQRAFNAWVRQRDAQQPCISCGAPPPDLSGLHAGRDAGHYRSTGSADHMRFVEDNCHAQCVKCNQWGAGMAVDYRLGLIKRIGLARVEALECMSVTTKWTREGLRAVRDRCRAEVNRLRAVAGAAAD